MKATPTWSLVLDIARELGARGAEFSRAAVVDAVMTRDPSLRMNTVGAMLQSMTRNTAPGSPGAGAAPIERISPGWYRLAEEAAIAPVESISGIGESDVILVGGVETKARHTCRARDLYLSPLFARRRRYAEQTGNRWYIISAEHGLISPDALVEPYDVVLAEQTDEYRQAWGQWVIAKLSRLEGELRGRAVEVHAGDDHIEPLRQPLAATRAAIRRPLAGWPEDEQIDWYDQALFSDAVAVAG